MRINLNCIMKLFKYYFRLYQGSDTEDGETVWTSALSWDEARRNIESEYHSINRLEELYAEKR